MLKTIRRLWRHYFELPEAPLEEIQRRYRPKERMTAFAPCPHCQTLVRGVHRCKVAYREWSPEIVKARTWLVALDLHWREQTAKSKKVLSMTRRHRAA